MDAFQGSSKLKLDAKGRLTVPARCREFVFPEGEKQAVLTLHLYEPCLVLYPMSTWVKIRESLAKLSNSNRRHGQVKRRIIGKAETVELDGSGRMPIGPVLRDRASLTKEAYMVGNGSNGYEIWNLETEDVQDAEFVEEMQSDSSPVGEILEDAGVEL